MRLSLIMILILILGVMMGMNSHAVSGYELGFDQRCSAKEAYDKGYQGVEEPTDCKIGEMSVVHEFWNRGKEARLKRELAAKAEAPESETSEADTAQQ